MWTRMVLVALFVLSFSTLAVAREDRWYNFAEDSDLRYYLDQKSIVTRDSDIHIFWVKSLAKNRDYFREEYNLNDLAYILTNYEMDCSDATYRVRQILMMDKNRRELNKSMPAAASTEFEPVPPESVLELAQEMVCTQSGEEPEEGKEETAAPASAPEKPAAPATAEPAGEEPAAPAGEEPGLQ